MLFLTCIRALRPGSFFVVGYCSEPAGGRGPMVGVTSKLVTFQTAAGHALVDAGVTVVAVEGVAVVVAFDVRPGR